MQIMYFQAYINKLADNTTVSNLFRSCLCMLSFDSFEDQREILTQRFRNASTRIRRAFTPPPRQGSVFRHQKIAISIAEKSQHFKSWCTHFHADLRDFVAIALALGGVPMLGIQSRYRYSYSLSPLFFFRSCRVSRYIPGIRGKTNPEGQGIENIRSWPSDMKKIIERSIVD